MDESAGENGVTDAERDVLGNLTGQSAGGEVGDRQKSRPAQPGRAGSTEPPRTGPLTAAELAVRKRVLDESGRIAREELPAMFPEKGRQLSIVEETPVVTAERMDETWLTRIGAFAMDVLGAPARRLGPGMVTAMGLAGVLLLMALLVVILVRIIHAG